MSDPGITYRTKEEINNVRETRDPIELCRNMILERKWAAPEELSAIEKNIRQRIEKEVEQIRGDPFPPVSELYTDIGVTKEHYVRGVEFGLSRAIPE